MVSEQNIWGMSEYMMKDYFSVRYPRFRCHSKIVGLSMPMTGKQSVINDGIQAAVGHLVDAHNDVCDELDSISKEIDPSISKRLDIVGDKVYGIQEKVDAIARHLGMEFQDRDSLNKYEMVKPEKQEE